MEGGIWSVLPARRSSIVRIWIRGNLPKCSEVKKPAEAASSVMCDVAFSKVMKTPMAPPSRSRVPTRSRMSPDLT